MGTELQQALVEVIRSALDAEEFIINQTPEAIQQLLMWHAVYSLTVCVLSIMWICFVVVVGIKIIKHITKAEDYTEDFFNWAISGTIWAAFLIPGVLHLNLQWLQIWLAPKVWLIEYASKLIK